VLQAWPGMAGRIADACCIHTADVVTGYTRLRQTGWCSPSLLEMLIYFNAVQQSACRIQRNSTAAKRDRPDDSPGTLEGRTRLVQEATAP